MISAPGSLNRLSVAIVVADMGIRGGTQKQVQRLADYLGRRGHSVAIHARFYDPKRCFPGVELLQVSSIREATRRPSHGGLFEYIRERFGWVKDAWRLVGLLPENVDVMNVHDLGVEATILFASFFRPRARIIWQINDLPYSFHVGVHRGTKDRFRNRIGRWFFRHVARKCHKITVNVSKNKHLVRECLGVDADLVYPGVELRNASAPERTPPAEPVGLVSTGAFYPYRNYETLLDVQRILLEKHGIRTRLSIVGTTGTSPAYADQISTLIRQLGVDATIHGEVSDADLDRIYRQAGYFLFLNINQSWGLAVFEAMNYRMPVIVSSSVGATELLKDGQDALIVNPRDAGAIAGQIAAFQRNPQQYMTLANQAIDATMEMSWDLMYCSKIEERMVRLVSPALSV